ncbi:MAG: Gfo/Idh/MocA family oxidoreductase, partial [Planctomycetota bacterium]|nr:Gfo/Idh/MocA family oxidoreductase [Planctomycetota bacterium]
MLRVGIVGAGPRGLEHAHSVHSVAGLEVAGFADFNPDLREQAARTFKAPAYESLAALCAKDAPEVLILATPLRGRKDLVLEALRARGLKGLVVEKPFASRLDEARAMVEAAERAGVRMFLSHQLRYAPEFVPLQQAFEAGHLGAPRRFRGVCFGNLLNQGPHLFDVLAWLTGPRRLLRVRAEACDHPAYLEKHSTSAYGYFKDRTHPAPMWMTQELEFEGGLSAEIHAGLMYERSEAFIDDWLQMRVQVTGETGEAEAQVGSYFRMRKLGEEAWTTTPSSMAGVYASTQAFHTALEESLRTGAPHRNEAREALPGVAAMVACGVSALKKESVACPVDESADPWEALKASSAAAPAGFDPENLKYPFISAVVPILDHREHLEEAIENWNKVRTQRSPGFEVVYLSNGTLPKLEAYVREHMRPQDRLVMDPTAPDEQHLYNLGAKEARGELLILCEPHAFPEPEF